MRSAGSALKQGRDAGYIISEETPYDENNKRYDDD